MIKKKVKKVKPLVKNGELNTVLKTLIDDIKHLKLASSSDSVLPDPLIARSERGSYRVSLSIRGIDDFRKYESTRTLVLSKLHKLEYSTLQNLYDHMVLLQLGQEITDILDCPDSDNYDFFCINHSEDGSIYGQWADELSNLDIEANEIKGILDDRALEKLIQEAPGNE